MSQVNLPQALSAAFWEKQKGALAKAAKAPPTKLGDELKSLTKLHLAIDWKALADGKADDADAVRAAQDRLEDAVKGRIKALSEQAKAVLDAATKFETEAGKDKQFPKEPLAAAASVVKAAREYRADIDEVVAELRKTLATQLQGAQKAKAAGAAAAAASPADSKAAKLVRSRALDAIRKIRKPAPGAKPVRFIVVQGKGSVASFIGPSVGPAQEKLLKGLIPNDAPFKTIKDPAGFLAWEQNAVTFVSDVLPGGLVKKMQLWLKKILKLNLKLRVRRTDGTVEESEGEALADDMLQPDAEELAAQQAAARGFEQRLAALMPEIRKALTGPSGAEIKELLASIEQQRKAGAMVEASGDLDDIELLLESPQGGGAAAKAGPADGEPEDPAAEQLSAALAKLTPLIQQTVAAQPGRRQEILAALGQVQTLRNANQLAQAKAALVQLGGLLQPAKAGAGNSAPAGGAQPTSPARAPSRTLTPIWATASDTVLDQTTGIVVALRRYGDAELDRMADDLLDTVNDYVTEMSEVLEEYDELEGEARSAMAVRALDFVQQHRRSIADDPLISAADSNPFGLRLTLKKVMNGALDEIAAAFQS